MSKVYLVRESWEDQEGSTGRNFYGVFSSAAKAMAAIDTCVQTDELHTSKRNMARRTVKKDNDLVIVTGGTYAERVFEVEEYELDEVLDEGTTDYVG